MPLVIPRPRVIDTDGKLHGYSGGGRLSTKEWLLRMGELWLCNNPESQCVIILLFVTNSGASSETQTLVCFYHPRTDLEFLLPVDQDRRAGDRPHGTGRFPHAIRRPDSYNYRRVPESGLATRLE